MNIWEMQTQGRVWHLAIFRCLSPFKVDTVLYYTVRNPQCYLSSFQVSLPDIRSVPLRIFLRQNSKNCYPLETWKVYRKKNKLRWWQEAEKALILHTQEQWEKQTEKHKQVKKAVSLGPPNAVTIWLLRRGRDLK